jgi:hypothetical protein
MAITMKGRHTIRAHTPSGREPRHVELWTFEPKENSTLARLERAYLDALEAVDLVEARKVKAAQGGTLTPAGVASDVLGYAASTLAPKLKKARTAVEQAKHEAADRRAKLVLKPADKTDAAGQMRRLYKLDKFNALSDSERNAYLAKGGDNLDPELQQAILEMPEYSKVLPTDLEAIHMRALKQQHGEEAITELANLEAGIRITDDVITAARDEVAQEVGGTAKLDAAAEPYLKMQGAAWLRKFDGEVRFASIEKHGGVDRFYWRPATAEQIENGVYFNNAEEWRAAQQGVVLESMKPNGGASS